MKKYQILLLLGGNSTEHEISLVSGKYVEENLRAVKDFEITTVILGKDNIFRLRENNEVVELTLSKELKTKNKSIHIDYVVPCIHGNPGETGDIQSFLEIIGIPYLGCRSEASKLCFNKVSTKLWFNALGIPNTPFLFLNSESEEELNRATDFLNTHKKLFIKASSQGSSVGCYPASNKEELISAIKSAFKLSPQVLIEILVVARELEVSAYEFKGEIHTTLPGEIVVPKGKFYSYDEKYANNSETTTEIVARNVPKNIQEEIQAIAKKAFIGMKLRHLSRIDFFYTDDGKIYLNEINTFPGMTPISMFPKMLENHGHVFREFLEENIKKDLK